MFCANSIRPAFALNERLSSGPCIAAAIRTHAALIAGFRIARRLSVLGAGVLLISTAVGEDMVAISSKVSKDYVRKRLSDGSYKPETYAFGEGDNWGGVRLDFSADHLKFMDVARAMAVPLAQKNYLPTHDKDHTDLL